MVVIYEGSRMWRERCATGATRGKSRMGEIRSSKFRVPRNSDIEPSFVSPFPPVSPVSRGDATGQGMDGEADHYGDIRPGVENL